MTSRTFSAAALLASLLGLCLLLAAGTSSAQQTQSGPAELARVSSGVAGSTGSLLPCVQNDFVRSLEQAAITGSYSFHESSGCDAWTSANLLEAFGGDAAALEAAGSSNAASPPRTIALTELEAYRLRVAAVPSGAALALSPTVTAVAVAPRAPGNQGLIVRAFRRFAALAGGNATSAERSAAGHAFDAGVTFIPAPFPRVNPGGDPAAVDSNPYPAGQVVIFVASSADAAARARAASPSVAQPSPLAAGKKTPSLKALLASGPQQGVDPAVVAAAGEEVITAWVGPWKPT